MLAVANHRYVVCHGRGEFSLLDPLTGDVLWRRRGVPRDTTLIGDPRTLCIIPNQSSVAKAYQEFDEAGRMRPSSFYDRVVDVMEELVKFTLLTRDVSPYLVDRYSERKESAEALSRRMNLSRSV